MARVPWTGPAADQFRGEWSGTAKVRLLAVTAVLEVASLRLQGNANAQDDASRPGGTEAETDDAASSDAGGPGNESVEPGLAAAAALPGGAAADLGTSADDGSREDQRQESRRDVSDSGSGTGDPLYGTPGPSPFPLTGLGPGTAGTAVTPPRPPEWHASDLGSDENGPSWNTEDASFGDHAREWAVQQAADLTTPRWPDAARNLHHYLDNSGETLTQPVDTMLDEIPDLSANGMATRQRRSWG